MLMGYIGLKTFSAPGAPTLPAKKIKVKSGGKKERKQPSGKEEQILRVATRQ